MRRCFRDAVERMNSVIGVFGRSERLTLDEEVEQLIQERQERHGTRNATSLAIRCDPGRARWVAEYRPRGHPLGDDGGDETRLSII